MSWTWEATNPGRTGLAGDLAKLFRNEEQKHPGVLAIGAPPPAATLLAREVIQNSWDAARELQKSRSDAPRFEIEFRFEALMGEQKHKLVSSLDLDGLSRRAEHIDSRSAGLGQENCLNAILDDGTPLRTLRISERATTGMYGPWTQNKSHMYLALVSLGYTEKQGGAGGSYGYGKAGLINGSRIRSVLAYSCFEARSDDTDVTRRLLGMTYWGQHDIEGVNYTGIGSLSAGDAGGIRPYENQDADDIASAVGLPLRDPKEASQLGTTFLLIDPTVDPDHLLRAVERSWWPAIHEREFLVEVVDYDGATRHPRPIADDALRSFIAAWDLALGRRERGRDDWNAAVSGPTGSSSNVGRLRLVADMDGWSYSNNPPAQSEEDTVTQRSLVALSRSPRMVVEYLEVGRSQPYLRGAFVADESIDALLRLTEPKGHDSWRTKSEEGEVEPEAASMANHVLQRIKQHVNNHRNRLKPPVPPPEDVKLTFFNEIMRRVMSGMGPGTRQPVPETRPLTIRLEQRPSAVGKYHVQITGSASFGFSEHFDGEQSEVEMSISYRFLEDDRVGEHATLDFEPAPGLREVSVGVFRGLLRRGHEFQIDFESEPYDPTWTGRLIVNAELVEPSADSTPSAP